MHWLARQVFGWCWMFDTEGEVHSIARGRPEHALRVQWGIDQDDVRYHPYWTQKMVKAGDPDFIVSVWTRPGTALIEVFNLSKDKNKTKAQLTLDAKALGLGAGVKVYDLESAPKMAELKARLAQFDAGRLDPKQAEALSREVADTTEPDFDLTNLRQVGDAAAAAVEVPARDFALLVVR